MLLIKGEQLLFTPFKFLGISLPKMGMFYKHLRFCGKTTYLYKSLDDFILVMTLNSKSYRFRNSPATQDEVLCSASFGEARGATKFLSKRRLKEMHARVIQAVLRELVIVSQYFFSTQHLLSAYRVTPIVGLKDRKSMVPVLKRGIRFHLYG